MAALKAEGLPFQGVLYFGLMLTPDGPKVVEYNARFGDPECQAVLSLLETDLLDIFLACRNGTLDHLNIRWKDGAACCLVLASGGYPGSYAKGLPITGLEDAGQQAVVFHAGTKLGDDGTVFTNGGRHRAGSERRDRQRLRRRGAHPLPGHALPHRHWPGLKPLRPKGCYCWLSNWMLRLVASIRAVLLR